MYKDVLGNLIRTPSNGDGLQRTAFLCCQSLIPYGFVATSLVPNKDGELTHPFTPDGWSIEVARAAHAFTKQPDTRCMSY